MRLHGTVMAVGLALAVGGCGAAAQQQSTKVAGAQCAGVEGIEQQVAGLYEPGSIERVEPIYRQEFRARAIQPRYVSGARLYVPAQQGMSEAYLERVLSCHAAQSSEVHPNDPLRVANVQSVAVRPAGPRFVIAIEGANRAAGKEIWQRAQGLSEGAGHVEVEQLSEAPSSTSRF